MANINGTSGNDTLNGTSDSDVLNANGSGGSDAMAGGLGDDVYIVNSSGDTVTENADAGTDTVQSSVTFVLGANVENLTLTGATNINGTGNTLNNVLTGNSGNNVLNGGTGADAMAGGTGNDTYVVDNVSDTVTEAASAGTDLVQSSVTFTLGANVENLTLTGAASVNGTGNDLNNVLTGNSGANVLDGGTGADAMAGGTGNDTYVVDNVSDTVTEAASAGTDLVQSSVTFTLGANVENLTLTGVAAINGTGNTLNNVLTGNSGNNVLDGGTGTDAMAGGLGDDTFVVDNVGDTVTENASEGTDTVQSAVTYTLGGNVENLTLTGVAAINGTGNALNNVLTGNSGNNVLDGGTGTDAMAGGLGDDTFVVDNVGDTVTENASEGTDTVQSSVTFTLGANVENLTLTGSTAINGTGNASDNVLTGNSGANVLTGGAGNDTYVVGTGDTVVENASGGTDTVQSSITFTLGANVENLTLTGTANINGTGNASDNVLTGNSGNNVLTGGAGNDTYVVNNTGDTVTEAAGAGTDLVQSSVTWTLGTNVENLTLTGTANINGTGNTLNNVLTGNSGNNVLNGGTGADAMAGGLGDDTFVVDNVGDTVTENASEGTDTVQSSVTFTLGANVENLTLTGTANINGTGNALNNVLTGNSGANVLTGGAGDDTYVVGTGDTVVENADEGIDTVQSAVTYILGDTIENLTLTGTAAINGTGNALNNVLTGNSGANVLTGGTGNDTYAFSAGHGVDTITDVAGVGDENILQLFTPGLLLSSYTLGFSGGFFLMTNPNNGDQIRMSGFDLANVYGSHAIGTFISSNGTTMSYTALIDYLGFTFNGTAGADTLTGTNGFDHIFGLDGNDTLSGGAGEDDIAGGNGADILAGGTGNDLLLGGAGNDTYLFNVGDGFDSISDTLASGEGNVVQFGASITLSNLVLTFSSGALQIRVGTNGDMIQLSNFDPNNAYGEHTVDTFKFADGSTLTYAQMMDWGFDVTGTEAANTLTGTNAGDLINGLGGDDVLQSGNGDDVLMGGNADNTMAGSGNDTLVGGTGADWLFGGDGNDTYQFNRGDGQDIVVEYDATPGNADRLLFGSTINPIDLVLSRQVNDLRVAVNGTTDQVTIQNWYGGPNNNAVVEDLQAGNGQHLLSTQVDQLIQAMATFSQQTGLTWEQGIAQQPQQVQTILAASWH